MKLPLLLCLSFPLAASAAAPEQVITYRNLAVARLNPLGLINIGQATYRHRLYASESMAFRDNFFGVGLAPAVSPAFGRLGVVAELQPASFLQLWASYEFIRYFGTFDFLQSFRSPYANFSDTRLGELSALPSDDPAANYAASGTQFNVGATLQAKVGPVAVRNLFRLMRPDYDLREGDRLVYDILFDALAPNGGWYFNNDTELLWLFDFGLTAGLRWTVTHAFYRAEDYLAGEDPSNPNTMHRLGPMFAYSFWKDRGGAFDNPTALLIANWWLDHRFRTGEDVSQAFPYLVIGFSFTGDLTPANWGQ